MKFIYICMAVVALSFFSIALQPMFKGIEEQRDAIAARNEAAPETATDVAVAAPETESVTPEDLNAIETAAGGDGPAQPDVGFGANFTNVAPKGLEDSAPAIPGTAQDTPASY